MKFLSKYFSSNIIFNSILISDFVFTCLGRNVFCFFLSVIRVPRILRGNGAIFPPLDSFHFDAGGCAPFHPYKCFAAIFCMPDNDGKYASVDASLTPSFATSLVFNLEGSFAKFHSVLTLVNQCTSPRDCASLATCLKKDPVTSSFA